MTMSNGCIAGRIKIKTFEWVIENATRLPSGIGEYIYSPDFDTAVKDVRCKLSLFPQGSSEDEVGYVSIYVHLTGKSRKKLHLEISTSQITNTPILLCTHKRKTKNENAKKISRSELLELCDSNDTFRIIWKASKSGETIDETNEVDSQEGQLDQAFRPLLKELKLSDIAIVVGNQKFPAHKVVLAARSPVFLAMFENKESQENLKNEVKIEEMEPAVVEAMLEFFYTDEVTNLEELAYGLLAAAELYDVQRLKAMCERVLYKILNQENSGEILIHAEIYRSYELKEHAMQFMADHLSDVVKSEAYKAMEEKYPSLLKELIRSLAVCQESKKRKLT